MIVADTDILIDYLADVDPSATAVANAIDRGTLATTAVSRFELLAGARGPRQQRAALAVLDAIEIWPLDTAAADRAAAVRRTLEKAGTAIGMADSLIAGIVLARGGTLCSRNERHFGRVDGLKHVQPSDL